MLAIHFGSFASIEGDLIFFGLMRVSEELEFFEKNFRTNFHEKRQLKMDSLENKKQKRTFFLELLSNDESTEQTWERLQNT